MKDSASRARNLAAALVLAGVVSSCALYKAHVDQGEIEDMATVTGTLEAPQRSANPMFVGLFRDEGGEATLAAYFVRYGTGPFRFIVPAGSYRLFAFEDANGNLRYDGDEPSYYTGDAQPPLQLAEGAAHDAGAIALARRKIDVARLRSAAQRDLLANPELTRVHRGTIISLDDPRFTPDTGREGMWTPKQVVEEYGAGMFFLEPYDPSRTPVVFVHGMSGTAGDFRAFAAALDRHKYQAWLFQYPSGVRIESAAAFLQAMLAEMQARHRFTRYAVVAHSMGGLVSRAALLRIQKEGGAMPCAYVTISTPWAGVESAEKGTRHSPVVLPAWIDLAPGSPFIRTLFETPLAPATADYLLFGYAGGDGTDGAVSLKSMLRPEAQAQAIEVVAFRETHRSILRSAESIRAVNERLACGKR